MSRQLSELQNKIRKLEKENDRLAIKLANCQYLLQPTYIKSDSFKHILFHKIPYIPDLLRQFKNTKDDTYFLTVTFDPQIIETIGLYNTPLQKDYLISKINDFWYQLIEALDHTPVQQTLFGCLEFQKNGTLHAHFLLQFYKLENQKDYINELHESIYTLKHHFTNSIRNKRALHWRPVDDLQKAIEYIIKEPQTLFKFGFTAPMVIEEESDDE